MPEKLPAFQFYPGDWMKDPELRACSLAARGMWIDLLCLMHESDRRGYLQLNGKAVTTVQIARMTGCTPDDASQLLQELIDSGAASKTDEGILFNRRMVRDERRRQTNSENGKKGGNPSLAKSDNRLPNRPPNRDPTPSSSSSSSVSSSEEEEPPLPPADAGGGQVFRLADSDPPAKKPREIPEPEGFRVFWATWPSGARKAARRQCLDLWRRRALEGIHGQIQAGLARWLKSAEWARDGGAYIPAPKVWLNQARWEADPEAADAGGEALSTVDLILRSTNHERG